MPAFTAVVGNGEAAEGEVHEDRLDIDRNTVAGGRIPVVPDGHMAGKFFYLLFIEDVRYQTHGLHAVKLFAVGRYDAGRLLSAVLKRVEPQIRQICRVGMAEYPEYAALFMKLVEHNYILIAMQDARQKCRHHAS
jgi:hypothetical protein